MVPLSAADGRCGKKAEVDADALVKALNKAAKNGCKFAALVGLLKVKTKKRKDSNGCKLKIISSSNPASHHPGSRGSPTLTPAVVGAA